MARSLVARDELDDAKALSERVLALDPDNHPARNRLSRLERDATPHIVPTPAKKSPSKPRAPWAPQAFEIRIPHDDAESFAQELRLPFFQREERGYKVAVHLVMAALLSPSNRQSVALPALIRDVFATPTPRLTNLGLTADEKRVISVGSVEAHGLRGAFSNLTGGYVGFWQFSWIPDAIANGFGDRIAQAFLLLTDEEKPLAGRVNDFRADFDDIAQGARSSGVRVVNSHRTSLNFAAMILVGLDPHKYTYYLAGALRYGYERYAPRADWPTRCSLGERYADTCAFVAAIESKLRRQGVPVRDLIDAQSMIWIRFRPPVNRAAA